jgi:hypothetical protein
MRLALRLALLVSAVSAVEELRFSQPRSLVTAFPDGVQNIKPALFGMPKYQGEISGRVIYATPGDRDGCAPINTSVVDKWPSAGESYIVMVDRGECTFVTKVRNVQEVGGKAVVIVDNRDETNLPFMADDGTGGSITIPSTLISKADGDTIKAAYQDGTVIATMRWKVPNPDGVVEWSLWSSSYDQAAVDFKASFQLVTDALADYSVFEPHYFFLNGSWYGCRDYGGTACGNQCTNSGRYCSVDPEHDLTSGISGADVVRENLRQICVWRNVKNDNPDKWWKYINCFQKNCTETQNFNADCSKSCQQSFGISTDLVSSCISSSGGTEDNGGENNIINEAITTRTDSGIFLLPSVIVNNDIYYGTLTCPDPIQTSTCGVLSDICAGYAKGTAPDACTGGDGCPLGQSRDACGNCGGDGSFDVCGNCLPQGHPDRRDDANNCADSKGVSAASVVGIVFVMVTCVSLGFFYIHRRSQASMRRELADIMQQYVPLTTSEKEQHDMQAVPSAVDSSAPGRKRNDSFGGGDDL